MTHVTLDAPAGRRPSGAWYRDVTATQWKAFTGCYLGWVLDGFDFTMLTFLLVDIQRSFTVDKALAGALGTITLIFRVAGGIGAGTAADRWATAGELAAVALPPDAPASLRTRRSAPGPRRTLVLDRAGAHRRR